MFEYTVTLCDYLSCKGLCGKKCFGGLCRIHRKGKSLNQCPNHF